MDSLLKNIAEAITDSDNLEEMVRQLLEILESITGLDSTYLTTIDLDQCTQTILFSKNSGQLEIPEGLTVPWDDSLCKRAFKEGRYYTDNVSSHWSDSDAAKALGIETYISQPVRVGEGELYGTLCGAARAQTGVSDDSHRLVRLFAQFIARQIERERLLETLRQENTTFQQLSLTDPLTNIPNRRAVLRELTRTLEVAGRSNAVVNLAFVDLDGFKSINDEFGHEIGDGFLVQIASLLSTGCRQADVVGRQGGDEFIVFGLDFSENPVQGAAEFGHRIEAITTGQFIVDATAFDYPGASVGVATSTPGSMKAEELIAEADRAMYRTKQKRKAQGKPWTPKATEEWTNLAP